VIHSNIETKLSELTPLIKQVALGQVRQAKVYGITLSWTILLIDAFKYKVMACLKLMLWVHLIANKRDITHFPIRTTPGGKTTRT
jgi:hypothetical protein